MTETLPLGSTAGTVDSTSRKLDMQMIAHHVWKLNSNPPDRINTYLVEDVLIDASTRGAAPRILNQLAHVPLSLVALTHCPYSDAPPQSPHYSIGYDRRENDVSCAAGAP